MEPKSSETAQKQVTVFVTIQVAPENIESLKNIHRPIWKACSEEAECLFFDMFQDPEKPAGSGSWRFEEQITKSSYSPLWEKSKPLLIANSKYIRCPSHGMGRLTKISQFRSNTLSARGKGVSGTTSTLRG
ncbi:hypothetical protein LSUE1_G007805, partial [Lachnellula suecica]